MAYDFLYKFSFLLCFKRGKTYWARLFSMFALLNCGFATCIVY